MVSDEDWCELLDDRNALRKALARLLHDPTGSEPPKVALAALEASTGKQGYEAVMTGAAWRSDEMEEVGL